MTWNQMTAAEKRVTRQTSTAKLFARRIVA